MTREFLTTSLGAVARRSEQRTHQEIPSFLKSLESPCFTGFSRVLAFPENPWQHPIFTHYGGHDHRTLLATSLLCIERRHLGLFRFSRMSLRARHF